MHGSEWCTHNNPFMLLHRHGGSLLKRRPGGAGRATWVSLRETTRLRADGRGNTDAEPHAACVLHGVTDAGKVNASCVAWGTHGPEGGVMACFDVV